MHKCVNLKEDKRIRLFTLKSFVMKKILHILTCFMLLMIQVDQLHAQAGTLDNSFNGNGIKVIQNQNYGNATDVAVQSDGKTVLVGRLDDNNYN